jgi:hypothetical protein
MCARSPSNKVEHLSFPVTCPEASSNVRGQRSVNLAFCERVNLLGFFGFTGVALLTFTFMGNFTMYENCCAGDARKLLSDWLDRGVRGGNRTKYFLDLSDLSTIHINYR